MSNPKGSDSSEARAAAYHRVGKRVLLVSDEPNSGRIWAYALQQMGLEVVLTFTGQDALEEWCSGGFDLLVIDVHSPDLDGLALCRQIRAKATNPILLFTARRDDAHVLEAYQAGVDECIVKPIGPSLFLAKVQAWLRRSWTTPVAATDCLQAGALRLDPARHELVMPCGSVVRLSALQFRLLYLLMNNQGQVFPPDLLIDRVWGYAGEGDRALLKNLVYRLRHKIEPDPNRPCYIHTVGDEGYSFLPR